MRIRPVVLLAVLTAAAAASAQSNPCDKPKRRDTLPLLEAAQADELLADSLEKVATTCDAKQPGCDDAKLKCQGFAESVNTRALVHDDSGYAADIAGGWLGSRYVPTDVIPPATAEPPASCSLSAAELKAEASARRNAALRHKKLQGEWEKWFTFAKTVSERCAGKQDGGTGQTAKVVPVPNPQNPNQNQSQTVVTNPSDVARERQAEIDRQKAAIDQKYDEEKAKEEAARKAKEAEEARKKAELYQKLQMEAAAKKKAEQEEQARVEAERKKRDAEKRDRELREKLERERLEREEAEAKARGAMEEAARKRAERDELERRDRAEAEAEERAERAKREEEDRREREAKASREAAERAAAAQAAMEEARDREERERKERLEREEDAAKRAERDRQERLDREEKERKEAEERRQDQLDREERERKERAEKEENERREQIEAQRDEMEEQKRQAEEQRRKEGEAKAEEERRKRKEEAERRKRELQAAEEEREGKANAEIDQAKEAERARREQWEQQRKAREDAEQERRAGLTEIDEVERGRREKYDRVRDEEEQAENARRAETESKLQAAIDQEHGRHQRALAEIEGAEEMGEDPLERNYVSGWAAATGGTFSLLGSGDGDLTDFLGGVSLGARIGLFGRPPWDGGLPSGVEIMIPAQYLTKLSGTASLSHLRASPTVRYWLGRFGLGVGADYRQLSSTIGSDKRDSTSLVAGPSIAVAAFDNRNSRLVLTGRWLPLYLTQSNVPEALSTFSADVEAGFGPVYLSAEFVNLRNPSSTTQQIGWTATASVGLRARW